MTTRQGARPGPRDLRIGRLARRWRRVFASIAALGLLGAAAQAHAIVQLERNALQARVDAVRGALHSADAELPTLVAQWNNFKNWNNWNNWKKWLNQ
jgi:hypothetical protein